MTRVLIALILSASPALAQVALQPKWDTGAQGSWTAADYARLKASQDAPWVKPREVRK